MAWRIILVRSAAVLAVCLVASCAARLAPPGTGSGVKEPPQPLLVKWDDLPIEMKKASVPPYSAISYCASRASSQGSDPAAVKAALAECLSTDLVATPSAFLGCHFGAGGLGGKAYAERRRKCLIQNGAKPG